MKVEKKSHPVDVLVTAFNNGSLLRNPEYQRGEAWSDTQKAGFVDSLFRGYPVPALFLREVQSQGLEARPVSKWEIVDGQQRLTALRDFSAGNLKLDPLSGRGRLKVPKSIAMRPAPWADRSYFDLSPELQDQFNQTEIAVFIVGPEAVDDEIRDLFIRLQSGTALSRQQIRDAWPGNLGPFVEYLAGKLNRAPAVQLFELADKRGLKIDDEDARDHRVADRQLCSQLLRIFVERERDPHSFPSVSANDLDELYHELTDFDIKGETARQFLECLKRAGEVFSIARQQPRVSKRKFRRLEVSAVMMVLQDLARNVGVKLDKVQLAKQIANADSKNLPTGKTTRGGALREFYTAWRDTVTRDIVRLDEQRAFDLDQQRSVRVRDQGMCGVCGDAVMDEDAEFDHWPVPWRDGGQTVIDNCRLVHKACHPRGRPHDSG